MPRHMTLLSLAKKDISEADGAVSPTAPTQFPSQPPTQPAPGQFEKQSAQKQQQQDVPDEFKQQIGQMVNDVMNAAEKLRSSLGTGFDPRTGARVVNDLKQLVSNLSMMMTQISNESKDYRKANEGLNETIACINKNNPYQLWNSINKAVYNMKKIQQSLDK